MAAGTAEAASTPTQAPEAPQAPADAPVDGPGLTVADLPQVAVPAPGAAPEGALVYLADDAGTAEAWLTQDGGYLRTTGAPERAVTIADTTAWAQIADSLGLTERELPAAAPPDAPAVEVPAAGAPPEGKAAVPEDTEKHVNTGIMVALLVPDGDGTELAIDHAGALPAIDLHMTLAFLGDTEAVKNQADYVSTALDALREVAAKHRNLTGEVSGIGRFSGQDSDPVYYSFDAPMLPELRQEIVEALDSAGLDVSKDHGFTPHITVAYIRPGEEMPLPRAVKRPMVFESMCFAFGDARIEVPFGPQAEDEAAPTVTGHITHPDSTAPSVHDAKAVDMGTYVTWDGGTGRVDLLVTKGLVPGVDGDVPGTDDAPTARVVVYEDGAATDRKVAVPVADLTPTGEPTAAPADDADGALVGLVAEYADATYVRPLSPVAVKAAYERGLAEGQGLARARALLDAATGRADTTRDGDLLPAGHPLSSKVLLRVDPLPEVPNARRSGGVIVVTQAPTSTPPDH